MANNYIPDGYRYDFKYVKFRSIAAEKSI